MTRYLLRSTQFERDTPTVTSGLYGALVAGTPLDVVETLELWETNDMTMDSWLKLANGRWFPLRLGGHLPYAEPA